MTICNIRINGKKAEIIECADILNWVDSILPSIEKFVQKFTEKKLTSMGELLDREKFVKGVGVPNRPINTRTRKAMTAMWNMYSITNGNPEYDVYPIVSIIGKLVHATQELYSTIRIRLRPSCDTDEVDNNIESLLSGSVHISEFVTFEKAEFLARDLLYTTKPIVSIDKQDNAELIAEMRKDPYPIHMTTDDLILFEELCTRIRDMRDQIVKVYSE